MSAPSDIHTFWYPHHLPHLLISTPSKVQELIDVPGSFESLGAPYLTWFINLTRKRKQQVRQFDKKGGIIIQIYSTGMLPLAGLGIRSFAHLLILLKSNEQLWAIRSDRSRQLRDGEQIAQVAQDKLVTVSKSLRLLMTNERPWTIRSGCSW